MTDDVAGRERPSVVIVGGGFGGLNAAKRLARAPVDVTVVDRRNHHLFQPLLYQVASAALSPGDIASPIRGILGRQKNARVILAEVEGVDLEHRVLRLREGDLPYDHLILAAGATHSYFGHPEWAEFAPGLKNIEDALEIRRRVLLAYEAAEREADPERRRAWLTFVVVGGGPTGTEMAGALSEIARYSVARDFRSIDPREARVILVTPKILQSYPEPLQEKALRQLERLGVEVHLGAKVTEMNHDGVRVDDEWVPARTAIWAAGVRGSSLAKTLGVPTDRAGRVLVAPDLTVPGHPEVQVIGDMAAFEQDGKQVFGVAPAAVQAGKHAARNILHQLAGEPTEAFVYRDKGALATIGRRAAVAAIGPLRLSGFLAWFIWLWVHVAFLIGFRNRGSVLLQWAWSYLTYQRSTRLITGSEAVRYVSPVRPVLLSEHHVHEDHADVERPAQAAQKGGRP